YHSLSKTKHLYTESILKIKPTLPIQDKYGRFLSYGVYPEAFDAGVYYHYKIPVQVAAFYQAQKHNIYRRILHDYNGKIPPSTNKTTFLKYLNITGTRYILINLCNPSGHSTLKYFNNTPFLTTQIGKCTLLIFTNYTLVDPSSVIFSRPRDDLIILKIKNTTSLDIKEQYNPNWKIISGKGSITETRHGFIHIDAFNTNQTLILKYKQPLWDTILTSLAGFLLFASVVLIIKQTL
ncbi:hypothetical protein J7L02_01865, partial [Candidatus Woesearchaeota archaeon]|nr:hypothetical protein [Candidatus Woesearchaeota archaeon]